MKRIYGRIRGLLPRRWKGNMTLLIYRLGIKPTVNKAETSPFSKGIIVLSADFEMAWAFRYSKTRGNQAEKMGLQERKNVPLLLSLFEKYHIPVTWATVGHLFLDSCNRSVNGLAHPEMPRPGYFENKNWKFLQGDWYSHDPCSNAIESPAWYAPDLISLIRKSPVGHEIGCHTFSHIDCTEEHCPTDLLGAELNACIKIAEKNGIVLQSLVFPGGTLGNYAMLKSLGFTNYRKYMKYHIDLPKLDRYGLVQIPSSYTLDKTSYHWKAGTYIRMADSFVQKAARHRMVAHLWFHPSMDPWYLEEVMPIVLSNIKNMADAGKVEVLTMQQLALRTLSIQKK